MTRPLRIGTRHSALALWQSRWVQARLAERGIAGELVPIQTTGDNNPDTPLHQLPGLGIFTAQVDEALRQHRVDLAVHSLKDLPTALASGVTLAAVSPREDPRDALVGRGPLSWRELEDEAKVAVSSLRRRAQLKRARPDLDLVEIRGNVDTRLAKLDASPDWAATVLAVAGLVRLGLPHRIGERLPVSVMLPAPGQGALGITTRTEDRATAALVAAALHDEATAACVAAERALLARLEGGCEVPVGALAEVIDGPGEGRRTVRLEARVISPDGRRMVEGCLTAALSGADAAAELGLALAERLQAEGAEEILAAVRGAGPLDEEGP